MKKSTLFSALAFSLLVWSSCGNKQQQQPTSSISDAPAIEQTRGTATAASAQKVLLARTWKNADKFVDIRLEGTFTANFGAGEFVGTWELNEDSNALVFSGDNAAEGKGHAEKSSFTLKGVSDKELKLTDAAGAELVFSAQ